MSQNRFLVTMQYNEKNSLPIFLEHYSLYFKPENIYVIDHGSTENLVPHQYNRIWLPRNKKFSEIDRVSLISALCHGLLSYYDYGVYADCDELICLDDVGNEIFKLSPVIYVAGFECAKLFLNGESKLIGIQSPRECKPLIFNKVPNWIPGFHASTIEHPAENLSIPMVHIKFMNRDEAINKARQRLEIRSNMAEREIEAGYNGHWLTGVEEVETFYTQIESILKSSNEQKKFNLFKRNDVFQKVIKKRSLYVADDFWFSNDGNYMDNLSVYDLSELFPLLIK